MNKINTVTVLIPTFQRAEKLVRAIQSVLNQEYADLEIIVCGNASTDYTRMVVKTLIDKDKRIKYYRHKKNIGMNGNFNFMI